MVSIGKHLKEAKERGTDVRIQVMCIAIRLMYINAALNNYDAIIIFKEAAANSFHFSIR